MARNDAAEAGQSGALSMRLNVAEASNQANAGSLWRAGSGEAGECGDVGSTGHKGLSVSVSIEVVWLMTMVVFGLCVVVVIRAGGMVPQEWSDPIPRM